MFPMRASGAWGALRVPPSPPPPALGPARERHVPRWPSRGRKGEGRRGERSEGGHRPDPLPFPQVARCTKIINPNTDDAKYVINVKQIAKVR